MEPNFVAVPIICDESHLIYECFIQRSTRPYVRLRLKFPDDERMSNCRLECNWNLQRRLLPHKDIIKHILDQSANVGSFLKDLSSSVLLDFEESRTSNDTWSTNITLPHILSQIENLGWDKFDSVDPALQHVNLKLYDSNRRPHILHVNLSLQPGDGKSTCTVDLPIKSDFHIVPDKPLSLQDLLDQFKRMLRRCEDFWDMMFEIDHNTWVLEPEIPHPSVTHRRIAIDINVSLQINVDAFHPRLLPECKFFGSEQKVAPFKEKLNSNMHKWDVGRNLLENLQCVLDTAFPSPADSSKEQFNVECGICYSYHMKNQIPDNFCDDQRCGQAFHQECLYQWLRALPSTRQSFSTVFGECPFCNKPITVKTLTSSHTS